MVGGPAPGSPRPIAGNVIVRAATSAVTVISVDTDGRYSTVVAPGTYRITGTYSQSVGSSGEIDECRSIADTTVVSAGQTAKVAVYCSVP